MNLFSTHTIYTKFQCIYFSDDFDAYIVVSFVNATLVLSIGETVEEVTDSGFLGTTPTLTCSLLGEDALLQVGQKLALTNDRSALMKFDTTVYIYCY